MKKCNFSIVCIGLGSIVCVKGNCSGSGKFLYYCVSWKLSFVMIGFKFVVDVMEFFE